MNGAKLNDRLTRVEAQVASKQKVVQMPATSDFETWYQMNEPEDQQDKDDLIQSVVSKATVGNYTTEQQGEQLFVSGWADSKLRLSNDNVIASFLRFVKEGSVPDDIDLDFQRQVEDPKS
jgi:hypothetical protein